MNETDSRYNKSVPAIEEALAAGTPIWEKLGGFLPAADEADGAAGNHEKIYRAEAAYNLIVNHEAVFRDLINPSPTHNIIQVGARRGGVCASPQLRACAVAACCRIRSRSPSSSASRLTMPSLRMHSW